MNRDDRNHCSYGFCLATWCCLLWRSRQKAPFFFEKLTQQVIHQHTLAQTYIMYLYKSTNVQAILTRRSTPLSKDLRQTVSHSIKYCHSESIGDMWVIRTGNSMHPGCQGLACSQQDERADSYSGPSEVHLVFAFLNVHAVWDYWAYSIDAVGLIECCYGYKTRLMIH